MLYAVKVAIIGEKSSQASIEWNVGHFLWANIEIIFCMPFQMMPFFTSLNPVIIKNTHWPDDQILIVNL